ncbi:aspartyl beta-hydroxylase [Massilia phosphatilytica]|nr:aspartyl beta-hydroxylase [Massilia phosphatilytica]
MASNDGEIATWERAAQAALKGANPRLAAQLWQRILGHAPTHGPALLGMAQLHYRAGALPEARALLERLVAADGRDKQQWINLAVVCMAQRDEAREEDAIRHALVLEPTDLVALILRAGLLTRQGKRHAAARAHGAVAAVAPPLSQLPPELRPAVQEAHAYREQYDTDFGRFLDDHMAPLLRDLRGERVQRFTESLDIMLGRKRRYEPQPALFHFQGLAPITFFDRGDFPWLDAFERETDTIRAEFLAAQAGDEGFTPYMQYGEDQPLRQWAELNNSLRWSAFHLVEAGKVNDANAQRCPRTMALLAGAPQPDQPGRTPVAMFSVLKPKTRIPPHCGVSNVRLVTHMPLVVPPGCAFRVGNDVRAWEEGKAWVFDDTIEHEAWNDSDSPRAILMFDIWHPHLTGPERALVTAMSAGMNAFSQDEGSFGL